MIPEKPRVKYPKEPGPEENVDFVGNNSDNHDFDVTPEFGWCMDCRNC